MIIHTFKVYPNSPVTFTVLKLGIEGVYEPYHIPSITKKTSTKLRFTDERYDFEIDVTSEKVVIDRLLTNADIVIYDPGSNIDNVYNSLLAIFSPSSSSSTISTSSDVEITDFNKGLILKSSDGTRSRLTLVKNDDNTISLNLSEPL